MPPTILITGANGQLGTVLQRVLRDRYGAERVIASDIRRGDTITGTFAHLDATDREALAELVRRHGVTQIYHLAAVLSATGERDPLRSWDVNMRSLLGVLETSRLEGIERVFYPSTIGVFGAGARLDQTPNDSYLDPLTVYGISKAAGENWAQYYYHRYGLDVRSLRYPGVIGYQSLPGGGTTDYAVDIFHHALRGETFTCCLEANEQLPMIYMDDAIRATLELMEAPAETIGIRTSYNISGCSFSPAELTAAIREHIPDFRVDYVPDFRQAIAAKWPNTIDDAAARRDWNWQPTYDLDRLVGEMIEHLGRYYRQQSAVSTPK